MNGSGDKVSPVDQVDIRKFLVAGKTFGLQQKIQWVMLAACNVITALHLVASVFISAAVNHRYTSSFTIYNHNILLIVVHVQSSYVGTFSNKSRFSSLFHCMLLFSMSK